MEKIVARLMKKWKGGRQKGEEGNISPVTQLTQPEIYKWTGEGGRKSSKYF